MSTVRTPSHQRLFPYTTLFRSSAGCQEIHGGERRSIRRRRAGADRRHRLFSLSPESRWRRSAPARSEEHTSELQSLRHLVCSLLLEKKNKNTSRSKLYNCITKM